MNGAGFDVLLPFIVSLHVDCRSCVTQELRIFVLV